MRIKLIAGVILCFVAIAGIATAMYAWNEEAKANDLYKSLTKDIEEFKEAGAVEEAAALEDNRTAADKDEEENQRMGAIAMVVAVVIGIAGAVFIVMDLMKVKLPGEEEEEKEAPVEKDVEAPVEEEDE